MEDEHPLTGRTIGITADRRGDDQVVMFRRLGADVVHGPTIATTKVPDPELLRDRTRQIIELPPDYLVADTGIGIRTWLAAAEEWGLADGLTEVLGRCRIAARGPKVAGALTSAGLPIAWRSPHEQLGELVDHLVDEGVAGKRVAFQLHGDDGAELVGRLVEAGASVTTVPVYVWTDPPDPGPAHDLIRRCCEGAVDAVTFTAAPQVRGLMKLAAGIDRHGDLLAAFNDRGTIAACIGPVCARSAEALGLRRPVYPERWRLGSLVKAVAEALA
jgi:uroporphyrinogen-III synthase